MQLESNQFTINRSAEFKEVGFKIKASPKAFSILSKNLYQNKIKIPIQELSTNAVDSHISAGVNDPFEVHLPNRFEQYYYVKDWGLGLSKEQIEGIYTTFFDSDKIWTNQLTGCLGLGSKTPFCYTDSFLIISRFNGKRYTYSSFINEDGYPTISLIDEATTNEKNGLQVQFATKPEDNYKFVEEARNVYRYFKLKPNIVGAEVIYPADNPTQKGNTWRLYNSAGINKIIMGNVAYPVDLAKFNSGFNSNYFGIEIDVDIGDVDITASREGLEYTKKTNQFIQTRLDEINQELQLIIDNDLKDCKCYFDACKYYSQNRLFITNPVWNNRKLQTHILLTNGFNVKRFEKYYHRIRTDEYELRDFDINRQPKFIVDDLKGSTIRVRYLVETSGGCGFLLNFKDQAEQDLFIEQAGILKEYLQKASDLPKRPKGTYVKNKTIECYRFHRGYRQQDNWQKHQIDTTQDGVYVELSDWQAKNYGYGRLQNIQDSYKSIHNTELEIYGVRKRLTRKVSKLSNWKHISVVEKEIIDSYNIEEVHYVKILGKYGYLIKTLPLIKKKGAITDFIELLEKARQKKNIFENVVSLLKVKDLETEINTIHSMYPMLDVISSSWDNKLTAEELAFYINAKDES